MLELKVFDGLNDVVLRFEHSLLSLSKWEEKYQKPFLSRERHRGEELIDYFCCMLIDPDLDPTMVYGLAPEDLERLKDYMSEVRTASTVPEDPFAKRNKQQVTSELIYSWMVALKIPFHPAETWHLSRLMMLIQMVTINNSPPKPLNKAQALSQWEKMNEANKKRFNSNG